jgi:hypothetical protein
MEPLGAGYAPLSHVGRHPIDIVEIGCSHPGTVSEGAATFLRHALERERGAPWRRGSVSDVRESRRSSPRQHVLAVSGGLHRGLAAE